jgi:hypothetical protein
VGVAVIVASPASDAVYRPVELIVPLSVDHAILLLTQPGYGLAANCCLWAVFIETEAGVTITGTGKAELKQLRETAATICKSGFISSPFLGLTGLAALQLHVDEHQAVKLLLLCYAYGYSCILSPVQLIDIGGRVTGKQRRTQRNWLV